MPDIKTKEKSRSIKLLDKRNIAGERMKRAFIRSKTKSSKNEHSKEESPSEYAEERINSAAENAVHKAGKIANRSVELGRKAYKKQQKKKAEKRFTNSAASSEKINESVPETMSGGDISVKREEYDRSFETSKNFKVSKSSDSKKQIKYKPGIISNESGFKVKNQSSEIMQKSLKTVNERKRQIAVSNAYRKSAVKFQEYKAKAEKAAEASAKAAKAITRFVRDSVKALEVLILSIGSGGIISAIVIIIICLIGLLFGSSYGIFFSNDTSENYQETINAAMEDIDNEFLDEIQAIEDAVPHDYVIVNGKRSDWKDILSIYSVKTTTDDDGDEVATVTPEKKEILRKIFWEMTDITYTTEEHTSSYTSTDSDGNTVEESYTTVTLIITITGKSANDYAAQKRFNKNRLQQLSELQSEENEPLWEYLLGNYVSPAKGFGMPSFTVGTVINEEQVWSRFYEVIGNEYGVAGLMGNLFAESGLISNNVQNSFEQNTGYTDETYTNAVDNGTYTNFVNDSAGYGLAQWTTAGRKQHLYDLATANGVSVSDLSMQVELVLWELENSYSGVLNVLQNATSVRQASNIVLHVYEAPLDQSEAVELGRAGCCQTYYNRYANSSN